MPIRLCLLHGYGCVLFSLSPFAMAPKISTSKPDATPKAVKIKSDKTKFKGSKKTAKPAKVLSPGEQTKRDEKKQLLPQLRRTGHLRLYVKLKQVLAKLDDTQGLLDEVKHEDELVKLSMAFASVEDVLKQVLAESEAALAKP